ncbi:sigma-70 family RNA polymerase sigma factor [Planococcus shixiaomingii]|uniref:sigma-70 family RNA polymerase sigma factor n=1 Tax=Planococcus shixiaomingii TaxID=3058393 RepID=UPI002605E541|nr:sigma-70 family RNA polymerase sigma factor [Planococcus sp. N022]WKA56522.1 sigma-70 family RNA polymerase sigma factor [Planococcus sp. N022]
MARDDAETSLSEEQLKQAMDQYGEYLIRLAYLYVKDWAIAEDIMQEVFLTYYRKADQFEQRSSLKTYLSKMTINKCHDHLRSWKNRQSFFSESIGNLISRSHTPEEAVVEQSGQADLMGKVMELPIKYQEVILLYYYQEFNGNEISQLLDCSENTVKTRLKRAKALLKDQVSLREWEGLPDEQI